MAEQRKRLGELLVEAGIISDEQLSHTLQTKEKGQKLGDALLANGYITEDQLIEVLEYQLGIPHISLYRYPVDTSLLKIVPKEFAERNLVIPLRKEGNTLYVAMNDPMDYFAIDDLRLTTGFEISPAIATKDDIVNALQKNYRLQQSMADDIGGAAALDEDDAPIVRLVNDMLAWGAQQKASDIHIDPQENRILIRYRVDGILHTERALSKDIQNQLTARIKIMANLNITEVRLPQDGRIKITIKEKPVDLRISTLPTVFGEKIVIRILDLSSALNKLSELGFNKINYQRFLKLIEQPTGMVLITGPTGSGKSSTLYAALNHLNSEGVNIVTVEDPVEYQIEGINQVQVKAGIGLTFAKGLRSILRQDPDIVMVGEIRDTETAEIAIRASLTGHLVFSTLHTNSSLATIPRLIDMGVEPFLVVSSLTGIVAQRLLRRVCKDCRTEYEPTEMEEKLFRKRGLTPGVLYRGKGCSKCNETGYKGRVAIHEILVLDDELRNRLMNNRSFANLKEYAMKSGMIFLIDDGLLKAKQGITTIEEVLRVAVDD
ncbi:ATPase, T2SS/T4P/T4SS family [Bacillus tianshenii]|nr:ATPase, T2SS/T4P/T4SS family [Bacillus tianshenii]